MQGTFNATPDRFSDLVMYSLAQIQAPAERVKVSGDSVGHDLLAMILLFGGACGQLFFTVPKTCFATFFSTFQGFIFHISKAEFRVHFPHFKGSFSTFQRFIFHISKLEFPRLKGNFSTL